MINRFNFYDVYGYFLPGSFCSRCSGCPSESSIAYGRAARYPSDIILDPEDKTFSPAFKDKLAGQIKTLFDIEVTGEPPAVSARRQDAFFLCRSALMKGGLFHTGNSSRVCFVQAT